MYFRRLAWPKRELMTKLQYIKDIYNIEARTGYKGRT